MWFRTELCNSKLQLHFWPIQPGDRQTAIDKRREVMMDSKADADGVLTFLSCVARVFVSMFKLFWIEGKGNRAFDMISFDRHDH